MKRKRFLAGALSLAMIMSMLPTFSLTVSAEETPKNITLGATALKGGQATNVYFGNYQQSSITLEEGQTQPTGTVNVDWIESTTATKKGQGPYYSKDPVKWRVLENANNQAFLLSDKNLDVVQYHEDEEDVTWETSTMRSWLNGYDASKNSGGNAGVDYSNDNFINSAFNANEKAVIADTTVENDDNSSHSTEGGNNTTDKIFLLSIAEAMNTSYGFTDSTSSTDTRIVVNTAYVANGGRTSGGMYDVDKADYWWLRSPGIGTKMAACVDNCGGVNIYGFYVNINFRAVRPAFKLNLSSVLFTSAAKGGKSSTAAVGGGAEIFENADLSTFTGNDGYKLTLKDDSRKFSLKSTDEIVILTNSSDKTVTIEYENAKFNADTVDNEFVSAFIVNNTTNEVVKYIHLANPTAESGTASFAVPDNLPLGEYTLKVFNEQINGDYNTDYASAFVDVSLTYREPQVTFYKNNGDTESYAIVAKGEDMPTNPTKDGYVFDGWETSDGTAFTTTSDITADTVVYAKWVNPITFNVTDFEQVYDGTDKSVTVTPSIGGFTDYTVTYYKLNADENALADTTADTPNGAGKYLYVISESSDEYGIEHEFIVTDTTLPTETYDNAGYLTIKKSGTDFKDNSGNSTLKSYNMWGAETTTFTYGDTITVKATPRATGVALMSLRSFTAPTSNQMALFLGDTQISEAVDVGVDGTYTMTVVTKDKALKIGDNTVTAKYVGTDNQGDYSDNITITLNRKPLTVYAFADGREYNGLKTVNVENISLQEIEVVRVNTIVKMDDVSIDSTNPIIGTLSSADAGTYAKVSIENSALKLKGDDAGYYTIAFADTYEIIGGLTISKMKKDSFWNLIEREYSVNGGKYVKEAPFRLLYGDKLKVKFTFNNDTTAYAVPDGNITLSLKDKSDTGIFNENGIAEIEITTPDVFPDVPLFVNIEGSQNYEDIQNQSIGKIYIEYKPVTFTVENTDHIYESGKPWGITVTPSSLTANDFTVKYYKVDENNNVLADTTHVENAIEPGKYLYVIDFAQSQSNYTIYRKYSVTNTILPDVTLYDNVGYMLIKSGITGQQTPIYFDSPVVNVYKGDTQYIENTLTNNNGTTATLTSNNESVAVIEEVEGVEKVKVVGEGSAVIIAKSHKDETQDVYASYTLNVSKKTITVTADDETAVYGTDTSDITNGYTLSENVSVNADNVKYDIIGYSANSGVGRYEIRVSGLSSDNYNFEYIPGELTVTAKALKIGDFDITANGKEYDGKDTATISASVKADSLVSGDTVNVLIEGAFDEFTFGEQNISYEITGLSGVDSNNYKLTGTLTGDIKKNITQAPVTVSVPAATTFVYDGNAKSVNAVATANGLYFSDFEVTYKKGQEQPTTTAPKDVGTYTIGINITNDNYKLDSTISATLEIKEAQQNYFSIEGINEPVYYGEKLTLQADGAIEGGTVKFEIKNDDNTWTELSNGEFTAKKVGKVTVRATSSKANYTNKETQRTFTVKPKEINVTAVAEPNSNGSKVYDGTKNVNVTLHLDGVVSGDTVAAQYDSAVMATADVENNKTVFVNGITLNNTNYKPTAANVQTTVNVTKRVIENVTFTADDKIYDGNKNVTGYTVTGLYAADGTNAVASGDKGFVTVTGKAVFDDAAAGDGKTVTLENPVLTGAKSGNYALNLAQTPTATANITKEKVIFDFGTLSYVYDGNEKTVPISAKTESGKVFTAYTVTYKKENNQANSQKNVGSYDIIITLTDNNYTTDYGTEEVPKKQLAITTAQQSQLTITGLLGTIEYGKQFTLSTIGGNGDGAVTWTSNNENMATVNENTGLVTIVGNGEAVTITATKASDGNYDVQTATVTFTPSKKTVSIKLDGLNQVYDRSPKPITVADGNTFDHTVTYRVGNETPSTTAPTNAGTYYVDVVAHGNYEGTQSAVLTIKKAPRSVNDITLTIKDSDYEGETITYKEDYTVTAKLGDEDLAVAYTGTGIAVPTSQKPTDAGSYVATVTVENPNYETVVKSVGFTIAKKNITVTADDKTRGYGEYNPELTLTYSDGVTHEEILIPPTASTTATINSPRGTYDIIARGGYDENYTFTYKKGTLTVESGTVSAFKIVGSSTGTVGGSTTLAVSYGNIVPTVEWESDNLEIATVDQNGKVDFKSSGKVKITAKLKDNAANPESTYIEITVDKKTIILDAALEERVKTYNGEVQRVTLTSSEADFTVDADGEGNDDNVIITYISETDSSVREAKNVGKYLVRYEIRDNRYSGTGTLTLIINKANVELKVESGTKKYGEAPSYTMVTPANVKGFTNETLLSLVDVTSAGAENTANVGEYDITAELKTASDDNCNYTIATEQGKLTVTKAPLTIKVKDVSREYGAENPTPEYDIEGFKNEETKDILTGEITFNYSDTITAQSPVDTYDDVVTAVSTFANDNYEVLPVVYEDGTGADLEITKIPVNASAGTSRSTYLTINLDKAIEGLGAVNFEVKNGDETITLTGVTASNDNKTYTLNGTFNTSVTYTVKAIFEDATRKITSEPLSVKPLEYTGGGGGGGGVVAPTTYTVKFETNGGSEIANVKVDRNKTLTKPTNPTKDGYTFDSWYTDKEFKTAYDFDTKVTKAITLYAKWTEKAVEPTEPTNPTNPNEWKNPFTDVKLGDWFFDSVKYAEQNGLINGTTDTTFAPNDNLTRAMLVTILYRAEGEPAVNKSIPFGDVDMGGYYANAVIWAKQNNIVSGHTENEFAPNDNITREQIATIIYRYAQYKGVAPVGAWAIRLDYADIADVADYAGAGVMYCTKDKIMTGKGDNMFCPKDNATRAEIAAILQRFIEANK